mmetsp:Transcript_60416/g.71796  ORF Transcript_60416/g.71796 Transcript_60416/m.71796 type:complete len:87 (+) Transcript_60416:166-426(+)
MQAMEKTKQDINSEAEAQFEKANAVYLRLQSEHDSKCEEILKLRKQLIRTSELRVRKSESAIGVTAAHSFETVGGLPGEIIHRFQQ